MRRHLLLSLFLLLSAAAPASARGLAFVINSGAASIDLLDVSTGKVVRRVPVLREPHHIALTPDHRWLLVGDTTGNQLLFLNPETGAIGRRMTMSDPYQLQFSPDGKWFVVNGLARNQVDIYAAPELTLVKRLPIASTPSHMNFSPDSRVVYVSLQGSNDVVAIDLKTQSILWRSPVGKTPAGVLWLDGKLLVAVMGEDYVAVLDPADGKVLKHIRTGRGAHNLFLTHDGSTLYVTNRVDGTISVLDPKTLTVERSFKVSGGPDDMDFGPDGKIWATRRWAHSVAIIDPKTGQYHTIQVGRSPHGIWLNTHDHFPAQVAQAGH